MWSQNTIASCRFPMGEQGLPQVFNTRWPGRKIRLDLSLSVRYRYTKSTSTQGAWPAGLRSALLKVVELRVGPFHHYRQIPLAAVGNVKDVSLAEDERAIRCRRCLREKEVKKECAGHQGVSGIARWEVATPEQEIRGTIVACLSRGNQDNSPQA